MGANISKMERTGGDINPQTFSAEGVEGYIPFTGPLKFVLQGYASGIKSGMSYSGAYNLKELREKAKFIQITNSGFKESNVHGISKFEWSNRHKKNDHSIYWWCIIYFGIFLLC